MTDQGRALVALYRAVKAGQEPAESLPGVLRERLFQELTAQGWTVTEVAAWTRTTEYTTARILRAVRTN